MIEKQIKKAILEIKDNKEKLLIEENLVKKRIFIIVESQEIIDNFEFLPEGKKMKIALNVMEEIRFLSENNILNEQLMDMLKKLFGNSLGAITQTVVEPMVGTLIGKLGLGGFFKDFVTSFLVTDPKRLALALKSCEELTKLISESLTEALVQMIQRKTGFEGIGYSFLRNAIGGAMRETTFVANLEDKLSSIVCDIFDKYTDKATDVYNKVKQ